MIPLRTALVRHVCDQWRFLANCIHYLSMGLMVGGGIVLGGQAFGWALMSISVLLRIPFGWICSHVSRLQAQELTRLWAEVRERQLALEERCRR